MSSPTEVQEAPKKEEMVALAERHAASVDKLAPRRTVFSTNMGVVRFAPGPDGPSVRHEIWYLPRGAEPVQGAQPHTVFIIGLKTPPSAVPPTLGAS
jgi:hypothetical protein